jgi:DNA-binding Lrp family transcriptional regulator
MPTKAFILIETAVGKTRDVSEALTKLKGVTQVDAVTGPYDIIAVVSASDLNAVGELVTNKVHTIGGIVRTVTCLSMSSST